MPKGEHAAAPLPTATKPEQHWPRQCRPDPAAPARRLAEPPTRKGPVHPLYEGRVARVTAYTSDPRGCYSQPQELYFPLACPRKAPATGQGTHPGGGGGGGRQPPGTVPAPWEMALLGSSPRGAVEAHMGDGNSHPAILKAAGRKLPGGSGFLCLETAGRRQGVGCNSKVTRLWEVTAGTQAPQRLGKGDAQGPSCCCVRARCPMLPAVALLSVSSSQANPLPHDSHFVAWSSLLPANTGGEGLDPEEGCEQISRAEAPCSYLFPIAADSSMMPQVQVGLAQCSLRTADQALPRGAVGHPRCGVSPTAPPPAHRLHGQETLHHNSQPNPGSLLAGQAPGFGGSRTSTAHRGGETTGSCTGRAEARRLLATAPEASAAVASGCVASHRWHCVAWGMLLLLPAGATRMVGG